MTRDADRDADVICAIALPVSAPGSKPTRKAAVPSIVRESMRETPLTDVEIPRSLTKVMPTLPILRRHRGNSKRRRRREYRSGKMSTGIDPAERTPRRSITRRNAAAVKGGAAPRRTIHMKRSVRPVRAGGVVEFFFHFLLRRVDRESRARAGPPGCRTRARPCRARTRPSAAVGWQQARRLFRRASSGETWATRRLAQKLLEDSSPRSSSSPEGSSRSRGSSSGEATFFSTGPALPSSASSRAPRFRGAGARAGPAAPASRRWRRTD